MTRSWDFEYHPLHVTRSEERDPLDVVVATRADVDPLHVARALADLLENVEVIPLLDSAPLFWTRIRSANTAPKVDIGRALERAGVGVRYVTSARVGSDTLAPPLDSTNRRSRRAHDWKCRAARAHVESAEGGRWFLGETGIALDRAACGTGAGARLAVIDDDAGEVESLDLDAQIAIGVEHVPLGSRHAALLTAWAVGSESFVGVAPDATVRHYYVPKPENDVFALPVAIAQAVDDGADVILCAANVDGCASPLLDDALELAVRFGRGGRGTAVVLPTSREMSSPPGSLTASLSLGFGEPASDPRVLCVAPSGRAGGWFLYRDRRGTQRPFSNRGPAVRWLSPGDDLADPFRPGKLAHAESSGAAAIAAGALLLVLATNPDLEFSDLAHVVTRTVVPVPAGAEGIAGTTHIREIEPLAMDRDGHNAKHGYGRIHVTRACTTAADPVSLALTTMGDDEAARSWAAISARDGYYSSAFAHWAVCLLLREPATLHALCAICRHARLVAVDVRRTAGHSSGSFVRQVGLLVRALYAHRDSAPPGVEAELSALSTALLSCARTPTLQRAWEAKLLEFGQELWPDTRSSDAKVRAAS